MLWLCHFGISTDPNILGLLVVIRWQKTGDKWYVTCKKWHITQNNVFLFFGLFLHWCYYLPELQKKNIFTPQVLGIYICQKKVNYDKYSNCVKHMFHLNAFFFVPFNSSYRLFPVSIHDLHHLTEIYNNNKMPCHL